MFTGSEKKNRNWNKTSDFSKLFTKIELDHAENKIPSEAFIRYVGVVQVEASRIDRTRGFHLIYEPGEFTFLVDFPENCASIFTQIFFHPNEFNLNFY